MNTGNRNTDSEKRTARTRRKRVARLVGVFVLVDLGIVLVLGLVPVSTDGLGPNPAPVQDYEEAVRRFERLWEDEQGIVNDASGSRLMTHGEKTARVYVLIHGTTNSPLQFVELGEMLHERGHNVLILRMPYHGLKSHRVSELKRLKAGDLTAYADNAIDIAAGLGEEIVVAGISGGGAVTAWIAQNRPEVRRALLLSPFLGIAHLPDLVDSMLVNLFARAPNVVFDNPSEPRRDWVYRGEASRGVAETLRLGKAVFGQARSAPSAVDELFVLTTASDDTADNRHAGKLAGIWQESGATVTRFEFAKPAGIPHNSIDPAADAQKKEAVYQKILELLGEEPLP